MAIPSIPIPCGYIQIDLVSILITFGIFFCLYLIVSLTVNLEFGYTGVPNFGKVLFVSVGGLIAGSIAYRVALAVLGLNSPDIINSQPTFSRIINNYISSNPYFGIEILLMSLAIGASVAAAVGYLASYPAIRLREDYLGMLLLAAGQFFMIFVTAYYPITGGTQGLTVPDPVAWSTNIVDLREPVVLGILAIAAVGVYLYSERVARSPLGRMMRAVRDNETSSDAVGKNTVAVRRNILIIASALSGIAGVLLVLYLPNISPTAFLRTEWTFYPFVIVILGGAANNLGVGVGTAVFVTITTALDNAKSCLAANQIAFPVDLNAVEPILIGAILIIILLWRPKGLVPEKTTFTMPKEELAEIMNSVKGTTIFGEKKQEEEKRSIEHKIPAESTGDG